MKKLLIICLCLASIISLTGCGKSSNNTANTPVVNDVPVNSAPEGEVKADIDLSELSVTMAYSQVCNILAEPDKYFGKTVKMKGQFKYDHIAETNSNYYFCLITDVTACCAQGMEFILKDGYVFPDDYPQSGSEICVIGVFDVYKEGEQYYCALLDAELR